MAVRKVVTGRQMAAARLLVDGDSAYRALTQAGYSRWTARNFGALLRSSWGLREALRREQESRQCYLRPAPARRRRWDRRPVATAVLTYCGPEDRDAISNTPLHRLYTGEQKAKRIAAGLPLRPVWCSVCRGPLEGKDRWCPNCRRSEKV